MSQTPELPDRLWAVWYSIDHYSDGAEGAIPLKYVAALAGCSTRAVQSAVKSLIIDHGKPIGSSCSLDNHGYYVITSPEEAKRARRNLINRAIGCLARARALGKSPELARILGQLELELKAQEG